VYPLAMKLAVLITYHNEKQLLTECLASIASQSRLPDEIWVYDDASAFPASDYLGNHAGLAGGVRVVRGESNLGPAKGRNLLLRETQADFVHFHDADDLFLPQWGARVVEAFEAGALDMVLTELRSERDGAPLGDCFLGLRDLGSDPDLIRFTLRSAILPAAGTYRREFVLACGAYREDLWQSEDYEFHVRLAQRGARFKAICEPMVLIRVRGASRSQDFQEVWRCRLRGLEILTPSLPPAYAADLAEAYSQVGSTLHRLGDKGSAKRAFALASQHGRARYVGQQALYLFVARFLGPLAAEQLGAWYRKLLPAALRQSLR
jgi:glycosyltransferase involved in cell wall biosynthesis